MIGRENEEKLPDRKTVSNTFKVSRRKGLKSLVESKWKIEERQKSDGGVRAGGKGAACR